MGVEDSCFSTLASERSGSVVSDSETESDDSCFTVLTSDAFAVDSSVSETEFDPSEISFIIED